VGIAAGNRGELDHLVPPHGFARIVSPLPQSLLREHSHHFQLARELAR
jgi:hypothetical protein